MEIKDKIINRGKKLQSVFRLRMLELYFSANAGHISCSLSCIDLLISILFFQKKKDDLFLLSKGHAAAALYVCLNELGGISDKELKTFYKESTILTAHPSPNKFKGIPFATGSLGHGFPIGAGIAKAIKLKKKNSFVYVLMSDGETNEGTTWEAAHFAVKHKLDNLILIIDKNQIQGFGRTIDVLGDTTGIKKWNSLGFESIETDGHDVDKINNSLAALRKSKTGVPKVLIANTIKGKGVSYMENTIDWHYWPMDKEKYHIALEEIKKKYIA